MYVNNSLSKKIDLLDIEKNKIIKWYTCGPTIYDSAHIGHARTFITFDIIRRILHYYGYNTLYVMNITDIDDKIINKVNSLNCDYYEFIKKMETEFWNDMDNLNVMKPNIITRVTAYIEKIIKYIEKIIENGYAYVSNGSVYFDYIAYSKFNNTEPLKQSNNDDYTECIFTNEKKHKNDFALWKNAKEGEICFDSPWGKGRCGWHIECSVMASDILGDNIDIHSGGIDLVFPHHNNEIVQVCAHNNYNNEENWIKYFLHSGHLNINGLKMSKSLKNFITIKDYLNANGSSNDLRMLFLLHNWDTTMDFSDHTIDEAKYYNKKIVDFLNHIKFEQRNYSKNLNNLNSKNNVSLIIYHDKDNEYYQDIINFKNIVDKSLRNNFDTPSVMKELHNMINKSYVYIDNNYNITLVNEFVQYVTNLLLMFGLQLTSTNVDMNFDTDISKYIQVGIDLRENIREMLKNNKESKDIGKSSLLKIYNILDDYRNNLKKIGINIEDRGQNKSTKWTFG